MNTSLAQISYFFRLVPLILAAVLLHAEQTVPIFSLNFITNDEIIPQRAVLNPAPLLTDEDILTYDWDSQTFTLAPLSAARIARHLAKIGLQGKWFVISVSGERRYSGAFWTPLSSISCSSPVIVYMQDNQTNLHIAPCYPCSATSEPKINDSRFDLYLKAKLLVNGKLHQCGLLRRPPRPNNGIWLVSRPAETSLSLKEASKDQAAYNRLYQRLGREDYYQLKENILSSASSYMYAGELLAAIQIFSDTGDSHSARQFLHSITNAPIHSTADWRKLDILASKCSTECYLEFLRLIPPGTYIPENFETVCRPCLPGMLEKAIKYGDKAIRKQLVHLCEILPNLYAEIMVQLFPADKLMAHLNRTILNTTNKNNTEQRAIAIDQMASFFRSTSPDYMLSHPLRLNHFIKMLKLYTIAERDLFFELQISRNNFQPCLNEAEHIMSQPTEFEELLWLPQELTASLSPKQLDDLVILRRKLRYIYLLLQAGKAEEAKKIASDIPGYTGDPWVLLNGFSWKNLTPESSQQSPTPHSASYWELPENNSWKFFQLNFDKLIQEGNTNGAGDILIHAIQHGKKTNNINLTVQALTARAIWLLEQENIPDAIDLLIQASDLTDVNALVIDPEIRFQAASTLLHTLADRKPENWKELFDKYGRREFQDGQSRLLVYYFKTMNMEFLPSDTIFRKMTSEKYQRQHGFNADAHSCRITYMSMRFYEQYVRDAVRDFQKYSRLSSEKAPYNLRLIEKNLPDYDLRQALLAKYLTDLFPDAYDSDDNLWTDSLAQREYWQAKEICETRWNVNKMSAPNRIRALKILAEKVPNPEEKLWVDNQLNKFRLPDLK